MIRAFSLLLLLLLGHTGAAAQPPVAAVAYHASGNVAAFGSQDRVWLFQTARGEEDGRIAIPEGRVTAVAFDPKGKWLAIAGGVAGRSGPVMLHSISTFATVDGKPSIRFDKHTDSLFAMTFSPDGKLLATAGYDRIIRVWDVPAVVDKPLVSATPRLELKDHSDTVYGLSFHPDGQLLASCGADRAVKVWDVSTGTRLYTLGDPTDWVYSLAWSPDRKHLAAGGVDRSIRVWAADRDGGKLIHSVFAHEKPVWRLPYSRDGNTLYSLGEDRLIKSWNAARMTETRVYPAMPDTVLDLAISPDGKQFAVGRYDGVGSLVETSTGKTIAQVLPAKPAVPKPDKLSPGGVRRGAATRVVVSGKGLADLDKVTTNSPEVKVTLLPGGTQDRAEIEVSATERAAIGPVQVTLASPAGAASPLVLAVDRFPLAPTGDGEPVTLPVSLAGTIGRAGAVDYYRFDARAGDQVGVQVVAGEIGSKLDPALTLTDDHGAVVAQGRSLLGYTVPRTGRYTLAIRDRDYRGSPDLHYRLHIGPIPVVTGVFPLAVQRGRATHVHIDGVNLGQPLGLSRAVDVPPDAAPGGRVDVPLGVSGVEKPLGNATVMVSELPSVVMDPLAGTQLRVPGCVDGILTRPNERQFARFTARKGEKLVIEVLASRAGSPLDPQIEVLDSAGKPIPRAILRATARTYVTFRDHDSSSTGIRLETWNEFAIDDHVFVDGELIRILALPKGPDDDCQFYQVGGQRKGFLGTTPHHHSQGSVLYKVEIHPPDRTFPSNGLPLFPIYYRNDDGGSGFGADSFLIFEAPRDDTYQVRITDSQGVGGPSHAYRLTVRPPKPDFEVSFTPTNPGVWKGGGIPINVTVRRLDGFDGPVRLEMAGLPAGLHAPTTFVEAGHTTTSFTLFANENAVIPANASLKLVGHATVDGKEIVREAVGGTPRILPVGDLVTHTKVAALEVRPGRETRFTVEVERQGKFTGRVPVDVRGLPHGVRVLNIGLNGILITERESSREVVLYAEPWVKPMEKPIVIFARSESKGTEHAAKPVLLEVRE